MKFAIYGQYYQNNFEEIISKVITVLTQNDCTFTIEENFYKTIKHVLNKNFDTFSDHSELDSSITAFISIGGDGTILRAATYVRDKNIPIVGINAGRLGFLATVQQENIEELLLKIIHGDYNTSKRILAEFNL